MSETNNSKTSDSVKFLLVPLDRRVYCNCAEKGFYLAEQAVIRCNFRRRKNSVRTVLCKKVYENEILNIASDEYGDTCDDNGRNSGRKEDDLFGKSKFT